MTKNADKPTDLNAAERARGAWLRRHWELLVLAGLILARTAVFTTLNWLQFRSFYSIEWEDTAAALQIIYHTAHGDWFYQSITGELFLGHFEPIYLVLALAYVLAPHTLTVFAVKSLGFSLGAVPVYLLVKRRTVVAGAALGMAVAYLLYAPLNYMNLGDVRGVAFCVAPLLFALYFFDEGKWLRFLACAVLAMSCKENVAFVILLLGPYALLRGRGWPWVVWPMVLGAGWFVFALKIVMPRILSGQTYSTNTYFNHWGGEGSAVSLALTILGDPINHLRLALSESRLVAARQWLAPVCLLPLLAPEALLLAVPGVAQIALLRSGYFAHIRAHWFTIPSVLIFAAAAWGAVRLLRTDNRLGRWFAKLRRGREALPWLVAVMCLVSNMTDNTMTFIRPTYPLYDTRFAKVHNMFNPRFFEVDSEDRRLWGIIGRIPPKASVAATGHLLPALANRPVAMGMWTSIRDIRNRPLRYTDCDYLLIDWHNYYNGGGMYRWPMGDEMLDKVTRLLADGGWKVVLEDKTTLLLKRDPLHRMTAADAAATARRLMAQWLKVQRPLLFIERGSRAFDKGDFRSARTQYLKAIETIRPDAYPYGQLCGICLALRDPLSAIRFGEVAAGLNPLDSFTWYRLSLARAQLGQMGEAIRLCKRALWLFPHSAATRALLAEIYQRTGRLARARRQARLALQIKFDDKDAQRMAKALGIIAIAKPPAKPPEGFQPSGG